MPELPEVETMRRGIVSVVGQRIESAQQPACDKRPIVLQPPIRVLANRVRGRTIRAVGRLGKRVLIELDDGQTLVIEPRMTGLVLLADPPTDTHLRLRLRLSGEGPGQLLVWDRRGLGTVRLMNPQELLTRVESRLGADALQISRDQLRENLKSSRRAIKVALLDQTVVAGIGNLYAAEILFLAGVDPRTRCQTLSGPQWERIWQAIPFVLEQAIAHEGSTLSDGTYRNALNQPGGYQNHHRVYDRADQKCRRCENGVIRRIVQAQRSTFFCPVCQRRTGCHSSLRVDCSLGDAGPRGTLKRAALI